MLVFKTETGLRDHILNFAAGKRLWADGAEMPGPHTPYPVIERNGVRTQFLPVNFILYTNIPEGVAMVAKLIDRPASLHNCIPLDAPGTNPISQHQIAPAAQITIEVRPLNFAIYQRFVDVIYDPDDLVLAEDGERLTRDQCQHNHKMYRCCQNIIVSSGILHGVITADTPIYCRTRGWSLQIARETAPYNAVYDTVYIPATVNKIIMTKDRLDAAPICVKCSGTACGTAYRIAFGQDYVCTACAHTISMFEGLRGLTCPEVPLVSPRDLLMLPGVIEAIGDIEMLITKTETSTYIGVPSLESYLQATAYEGLPYPDPVLYRINII